MEVDGWDCSFPQDASNLEPSTNTEPLSECGCRGRYDMCCPPLAALGYALPHHPILTSPVTPCQLLGKT